jgi:hypothetical protein
VAAAADVAERVVAEVGRLRQAVAEVDPHA